MTRRVMLFWIAMISLYIVAVISLGLALFLGRNPQPTADYYMLFKDTIPLLLALPAALIAFIFQQRLAFLKQIHEMYAVTVKSVQFSIQYTHIESPKCEDYAKTKMEMAIAIEMIRSCFKNIDAEDTAKTPVTGLFPFEALKAITIWIDRLPPGHGFDFAQRKVVRDKIVELWVRRSRSAILYELERSVPTAFSSPYWKSGNIEEFYPLMPREDKQKVVDRSKP